MTSMQSRAAKTTMSVRRPDASVWQHALRLADGDPYRLEVRDDGSVLVRNKPGRGRTVAAARRSQQR